MLLFILFAQYGNIKLCSKHIFMFTLSTGFWYQYTFEVLLFIHNSFTLLLYIDYEVFNMKVKKIRKRFFLIVLILSVSIFLQGLN